MPGYFSKHSVATKLSLNETARICDKCKTTPLYSRATELNRGGDLTHCGRFEDATIPHEHFDSEKARFDKTDQLCIRKLVVLVVANRLLGLFRTGAAQRQLHQRYLARRKLDDFQRVAHECDL